MLIRPELQVLRSNDAPQRSAQLALHTALQTWRTTGPGAQAEAELTRFHRGEPLDNLPLLYSLFCPADDGVRGFVDSLLHPLLRQLSSEPLGQSPLRFSTSDASSTVMLARCGTSALSLQHVSGACLQRGAAPADVMAAVRADDDRLGVYRPCPCGSGEKFRFCHGPKAAPSPFSAVAPA